MADRKTACDQPAERERSGRAAVPQHGRGAGPGPATPLASTRGTSEVEGVRISGATFHPQRGRRTGGAKRSRSGTGRKPKGDNALRSAAFRRTPVRGGTGGRTGPRTGRGSLPTSLHER